MCIQIIKGLRMLKSKLQIPLNQVVEKVILVSESKQLKNIEIVKEDIQKTIRLGNLEIIEKSIENSIKEKPDLKENLEDLNIVAYFFK